MRCRSAGSTRSSSSRSRRAWRSGCSPSASALNDPLPQRKRGTSRHDQGARHGPRAEARGRREGQRSCPARRVPGGKRGREGVGGGSGGDLLLGRADPGRSRRLGRAARGLPARTRPRRGVLGIGSRCSRAGHEADRGVDALATSSRQLGVPARAAPPADARCLSGVARRGIRAADRLGRARAPRRAGARSSATSRCGTGRRTHW